MVRGTYNGCVELRFTRHARRRMQQREVSREDVEMVIANPDSIEMGETAVHYDRMLRGRRLRAVVVRDSSPPLVITVMEIWT